MCILGITLGFRTGCVEVASSLLHRRGSHIISYCSVFHHDNEVMLFFSVNFSRTFVDAVTCWNARVYEKKKRYHIDRQLYLM